MYYKKIRIGIICGYKKPNKTGTAEPWTQPKITDYYDLDYNYQITIN